MTTALPAGVVATPRPSQAFWQPHSRQGEVYDIIRMLPHGSRLLLGYGGAVGGGKTVTLAEVAIDLCLTYPGSRILIGRHHYEDLRTTTQEEFDNLLDPSLLARKYDSHPIYRDVRDPRWPAGVYSRVYFRGVERASVRIGSEAYNWILLEEGHEIRERDILYLFSRLRHPSSPKWGIIVGFNPFPGWCVDWFMDGKLDAGRLGDEGLRVAFVRSRLADNPGVDPGYERMLRATYPPYLAQRLIDGIAGAVENAIYPQFERSFHVRELPPELRRGVGEGGAVDGAIGCDWGRRHIWAMVAMLKDALNRRWVVETIVGENGRLDQIAQAKAYLQDKWHITRGRTDREPLDQMLGFNLTRPNREGRIGYITALLNHHEGPFTPLAYQRGSIYGPHLPEASSLPQAIPAAAVTDGPLPLQTPALIIAANGPGNQELITEIQLYHRVEIETSLRHEYEVYRVGEDRVAAMEDAEEELQNPARLMPIVGTIGLRESGAEQGLRPDPYHWPEPNPDAQPSRPQPIPGQRLGALEGAPVRRRPGYE